MCAYIKNQEETYKISKKRLSVFNQEKTHQHYEKKKVNYVKWSKNSIDLKQVIKTRSDQQKTKRA